MSEFWRSVLVGGIIGLIIGDIATVFIMALCYVAKEADKSINGGQTS